MLALCTPAGEDLELLDVPLEGVHPADAAVREADFFERDQLAAELSGRRGRDAEGVASGHAPYPGHGLPEGLLLRGT